MTYAVKLDGIYGSQTEIFWMISSYVKTVMRPHNLDQHRIKMSSQHTEHKSSSKFNESSEFFTWLILLSQANQISKAWWLWLWLYWMLYWTHAQNENHEPEDIQQRNQKRYESWKHINLNYASWTWIPILIRTEIRG